MGLGLQAAPIFCATDAEIGRPKPDSRGLFTVLNRAGVPPQRAVMIGDCINRDGAAAQRVGVPALIRTRKSHPEFATFRSYGDALFLRSPKYWKHQPGLWSMPFSNLALPCWPGVY